MVTRIETEQSCELSIGIIDPASSVVTLFSASTVVVCSVDVVMLSLPQLESPSMRSASTGSVRRSSFMC